MKLHATFRGADRPFEGDLPLALRGLPVDAQIQSARATIRPALGNDQLSLFQELVSLSGGSPPFGVTVDRAPDGSWAAVDFHARRTVIAAGVLAGDRVRVQIDMGGIWVPIHNDGTIAIPVDSSKLDFSVQNNAIALLSVVTTRLKILPSGISSTVDLRSVVWRSVPAGVSLRVGNQGPFWIHLPDLLDEQQSADFTLPLTASLLSAAQENGHAVVPFTVHTDSLARLEIDLELDYLRRSGLLPAATNAVNLSYRFEPLPTTASPLTVALPHGAVVIPGSTALSAHGSFAPSRVALGPSSPTDGAAVVRMAIGTSFAQPFQLPADVALHGDEIAATAVDLLVAGLTSGTALAVTILGDAGGKPWGESLISEPVTVPVPPATAAGAPTWISTTLPDEFRVQPRDANGQPRRYWLVVNALQGEATWAVNSAQTGDIGLYQSVDGGLSWQATELALVPGSLAGLFRLRATPSEFSVPITLQVGSGPSAEQVSLDRLQPSGRIDATLDFPEVATAFDRYLATQVGQTCDDAELIVNGDFTTWDAIGGDISGPRSIPLGAAPQRAAFSVDGDIAYLVVGDDEMTLVALDVACGRQLWSIDLGLGTVGDLAVAPDGGRVYILWSDEGKQYQIVVIDALAAAQVGGAVPLESTPQALAVSANGTRLYLGESERNTDNVVTSARVRVLDSAKLEQAAIATLAESHAELSTISLATDEPIAIAVSTTGPTRDAAWVLTRATGNEDAEPTARFYLIDTRSDALPPGSTIDVPALPIDFEFSADGRSVLLLAADSLRSVDATARRASGTIAPLPNTNPGSLGISPDGTRAWIVGVHPFSVTVIDLGTQRAEVLDTDVNTTPIGVAVARQGDWVYVGGQPGGRLAAFQVGLSMPADWTLMSGSAAPFCPTDAAGPATLLIGRFGDPPVRMDASLSQVVPARGGCRYDLRFRGVASDPGAVAEVFWLGDDCGLLGQESVPLSVVEQTTALSRRDAELEVALNAIGAAVNFDLQLGSFIAPEGTVQAEVRFLAPAGSGVLIDSVSFRARNQLLANADLAEEQDGVPAGWTVEPSDALSTTLNEQGVVLQAVNRSVSLTQSSPVVPGQAFSLVLGAHVTSGSDAEAASLQLSWLSADGSDATSPTTQTLDQNDFDQYVLEGVVPDGAAQSRFALVLPRGAAIEVSSLALSSTPTTQVPVTFLSEAPGQLTVSQATVVYDVAPASAPSLPPSGLCQPTPPGRSPGSQPDDWSYCPCCGSMKQLLTPTTGMLPSGRPATMARCPTCGTTLIQPGGQERHTPLPLPRRRVVRTVPMSRGSNALAAAPETAAPHEPIALTDVSGIGTARQRQLVAAGIDSVRRLAEASTDEVRRALRGISELAAHEMIDDARRRLGLHSPAD